MVMVGALEASNECEKTKKLVIYCVFIYYCFVVSHVFGCQKAPLMFLCNGSQFSLQQLGGKTHHYWVV
jgi:hypothetical protein